MLRSQFSPVMVSGQRIGCTFGLTEPPVTKSVFVIVPLSKHLAGQHDQSTHGSWADKKTISFYAGNGFTVREVMDLQRGMSDPLAHKVYDAEEKMYPTVVTTPPPVAPALRDFPSSAEYNVAYKEYSKAHDVWGQEQAKILVTDLGAKHLDGTRKGVERYVQDVIRSDWFIENFGDGGKIGIPEVFLTNAQSYGGQFELGISQTGKTRNRISISKIYAMREPTLLHEIAHYATALTATDKYHGHGSSFTANLVAITSHFVGEDKGAKLKTLYDAEGVPVAKR